MVAWLGSVVVVAFVMAATPGPNNAFFAAAGARNGYRRTLPMLGGMLAGFVALVTGKLGPNSPGGTLTDLVAASLFLATVWLSASGWTLFGAALRARLGPDPGGVPCAGWRSCRRSRSPRSGGERVVG